MIFKVIWWSIKIIAVCLLVAIISNQEGISEIEWIGWKMEVPTSILIGGLIILILIILWIYNLWKIILNLPSKIFRMIRENRQKSGYNALAYGLVASSAGDVESAQKYAAQAKRLLDNKELNLVVKSPLITSIDKLNIFESLLKKINANELTSTFLKVIEKNKRFSNLASIITQFMNINSQKRGDVLADITSAGELNDDQKNNITNQLKSILGDKLSLSFDVDKSIMGGLIVKVGSKMIDTSLANKINKLKIAMKGA
mgnify:CR=1 FL=1